MGVTVDDLLGGQLTIRQPVRGPRVNMDTILLAGFVRLKRRERALELGCATGGVAMLMAWRSSAHVTGLEIDQRFVELARQNAESNGLSDRLSFVCGDLTQLWGRGQGGEYDVVAANPPYEEIGQGQPCASPEDRTARQGSACTLSDVCRAASWSLRDKGRLYMVMRARRLADTVACLRAASLEPSVLRFVHPKADRPASVFLMEARRFGGVGLRVLRSLVMHAPDGSLTDEFLKFYEKEAPSCPSS